MTQDEIIEMARQVGLGSMGIQTGFVFFQTGANGLEAFAKLVAAKERERLTDAAMKAAEKAVDVAIALEREVCAKVCGRLADEALVVGDEDAVMCFEEAEDAIRARGEV